MTFNNCILFFLLVAFFSCEKNTEKHSQLTHSSRLGRDTILAINLNLNPNEGLVYYSNKPFSGTSVLYYEDDITVSSTTQYVDGKKEGVFKMFFPDGKISFEANYKNGRREGEVKSWWSNGNLRSKSFFVNDIGEGEQLQWYKSGAKFKKLNLVNGREEGLQQSWRENGKLYNNYEAKNGRIFGLKRASLCYQLDDETIQFTKQ